MELQLGHRSCLVCAASKVKTSLDGSRDEVTCPAALAVVADVAWADDAEVALRLRRHRARHFGLNARRGDGEEDDEQS